MGLRERQGCVYVHGLPLELIDDHGSSKDCTDGWGAFTRRDELQAMQKTLSRLPAGSTERQAFIAECQKTRTTKDNVRSM
jgi:hypothetical protein